MISVIIHSLVVVMTAGILRFASTPQRYKPNLQVFSCPAGLWWSNTDAKVELHPDDCLHLALLGIHLAL